MTNQVITDRLTQSLPGLIHPGDGKTGPIPLPAPMFRNSALPDAQAQQFAKEAGLPSADFTRLFAEAIVANIETDHEILTKEEVAQLRADAASGRERHRQPRVHCNGCGTFLFSTNIDSERPTVNGPQLIKAMQGMNPDCSTNHGTAQ